MLRLDESPERRKVVDSNSDCSKVDTTGSISIHRIVVIDESIIEKSTAVLLTGRAPRQKQSPQLQSLGVCGAGSFGWSVD